MSTAVIPAPSAELVEMFAKLTRSLELVETMLEPFVPMANEAEARLNAEWKDQRDNQRDDIDSFMEAAGEGAMND